MAVPHEIGYACALGQVGVVEAWLGSDSAHHPDDQDEHWHTPLLSIAAERGGCDMIRMLIAKGATVDQRNERGWTPLMHAASLANFCTMELLIDTYGANIHAESHDGYTVLMIAVENGWHSDLTPEGVLFLLRQAVFKSIYVYLLSRKWSSAPSLFSNYLISAQAPRCEMRPA